jgi:hypothetical protein
MNFDLFMPRWRNGGGGGMYVSIFFLINTHNEEILKVSICFGVGNKFCIKIDRFSAYILQP